MNEIKKYKFCDLYDMASGISSTKGQAGHGAPFLSFGTVFNNYFLPENLIDKMDTTIEEQNTFSIKKGDVFVTRTSETIDELAMSSVALKDYPNATYSGFVKRLRPKTTGIVYDKFLAFYLRSKLFRKTMTNNATMTLRASFNEDIFSFLYLYLPPYEEQKKIGDLLYNIEMKMLANKKINDNLEAQVSAIYHSMFDEQNEWSKGSVSDFGEIVGGATPSKDIDEYFCSDGIVWLTPKDLTSTGNKFIYKGETDITEAAYHSCSTKLLPKGSVLLSSRAPVGCVAIAMTDLCTNQGFKSIIPKSEFGTAFVYYFLKENRQLLESHSSGTTFMEISGNVLKAIPVSIPPEELTKKFSSICEPIFAYQEQIEAEIFQLLELQRTMVSQISSR